MSDDLPALLAALEQHGLPDIIVAVFGNGRCDARLRGREPVIAEAPDIETMHEKLHALYPHGYAVDIRHDPHM